MGAVTDSATALDRLGPPHTSAFTAMVVDEHPVGRETMAQRLRGLGASDVVEAAGTAEARAAAGLTGPRELCTLDLSFSGGSGLHLLGELRALGWPHVLVVCETSDVRAIRAAFLAGAHGYLFTTASAGAVGDGVRRVLGGGVYADPAPARQPGGSPRPAGSSSALSGREVEVLQLVAEGQSNKQIGGRLGLSSLTVKSHLARIGRKLGTGDRAEMVAHAMRAGTVS